MSGPDPEPRPRRRRPRLSAPNPTLIARRRAAAIGLAVAATVGIYLLLFGGGDDGPTVRIPPETSTETRGRLARLSAEQKAEQLVLAGVDPDLERLEPAGGYLIDESSWEDPKQGSRLITDIRERSTDGEGEAIPPLIATRQEGGEFRALDGLPPEQRAIEIGDIGRPAAARRWEAATAAAIADRGFDLNLAPVADIGTLDSPINDRSFSDDPRVVAALVSSAVEGCRAEGVICAPTHFPGLGGASQDTNLGPATVSIDRATILSREIAPFEAAFAADGAAVVVSNALYAAYDPVTPASLSREILVGLLREEAGFRGVAITDDLAAGAIRAQTTASGAAVRAINSGADLVQISDPELAERALEEVRSAAASGVIREDRLNQAAARVLELKRRAGLLN